MQEFFFWGGGMAAWAEGHLALPITTNTRQTIPPAKRPSTAVPPPPPLPPPSQRFINESADQDTEVNYKYMNINAKTSPAPLLSSCPATGTPKVPPGWG